MPLTFQNPNQTTPSHKTDPPTRIGHHYRINNSQNGLAVDQLRWPPFHLLLYLWLFFINGSVQCISDIFVFVFVEYFGNYFTWHPALCFILFFFSQTYFLQWLIFHLIYLFSGHWSKRIGSIIRTHREDLLRYLVVVGIKTVNPFINRTWNYIVLSSEF